MVDHSGSCLCGEVKWIARGDPRNPHLCSCVMCQKSSGAPTVAWVSFPLEGFEWKKQNFLGFYQSSENVQRCFCKKCGCLLGVLEEGGDSICLTIASLDDPSLIVPGKQHSFQESKPSWWRVGIEDKVVG